VLSWFQVFPFERNLYRYIAAADRSLDPAPLEPAIVQRILDAKLAKQQQQQQQQQQSGQ
jgi:hypothetical protein